MNNTDNRRRVCLHGDESDVHTGWRRVIAHYQRAGSTKKVKRRTNRRERREGREEARQGAEW